MTNNLKGLESLLGEGDRSLPLELEGDLDPYELMVNNKCYILCNRLKI